MYCKPPSPQKITLTVSEADIRAIFNQVLELRCAPGHSRSPQTFLSSTECASQTSASSCHTLSAQLSFNHHRDKCKPKKKPPTSSPSQPTRPTSHRQAPSHSSNNLQAKWSATERHRCYVPLRLRHSKHHRRRRERRWTLNLGVLMFRWKSAAGV